MSFAPGTIVRVRHREWIVQQESTPDLLYLRPLGGLAQETTAILPALEPITTASFSLPGPQDLGDFTSGRLLRDAVRLGFRSSAGPFRSFGHLGFEPRPYQLVPLLLGLRQEQVRLLIADDVGIGKTVEAGLIARELLDRGEARRLAVLCPPHLAEQWQRELSSKFHIEAELVLPGTVRRLERDCGPGQSLFDLHPHVIVSIDYIKNERHRHEFLRTCPELVIVDEAHTCAFGASQGRHHRYELLKDLADPKYERHLILVTATPHSGNEMAFRSLLGLLSPEFKDLPEDLSGEHHRIYREQMAKYMVQRRRKDITHYMQADTPFPTRHEIDDLKQVEYSLSTSHRELFEKVIAYAREMVKETNESKAHRRVSWWSALALLRSLSSSPAAAVATLRNRAFNAGEDTNEIDEQARRLVFDMEEDGLETLDMAPGADDTTSTSPRRQKLNELARLAEKLTPEEDTKLQQLKKIVQNLLKQGCQPIIFCRFIPTAEYVAEHLKKMFKNVSIAAVTGQLAHEEREQRVAELGEADQRILVCTDCLSEGINLQNSFDAVIHYDLAWNPTRHEQREGRVDRFGQPKSDVYVVSYYGKDNFIDKLVLDVLLRKHKTIRNSLGISVPVPGQSDQMVEAFFEGLLFETKHRPQSKGMEMLPGLAEELKVDLKDQIDQFHLEWNNASDREKLSQTYFAQASIKPEEVAKELADVQQALGSGHDVEVFIRQGLALCRGHVIPQKNSWLLDLQETEPEVREALGVSRKLTLPVGFQLPVPEKATYLNRTHPLVEGLAAYLLDSALSQFGHKLARRAGVIRTTQVTTRTVLLLLRLRYHLHHDVRRQRVTHQQESLVEDCLVVAYQGSGSQLTWLAPHEAQALLELPPEQNVPPTLAQTQLQEWVAQVPALGTQLEAQAKAHGESILASHARVRQAAKQAVGNYRIELQPPVDILGVYLYLPTPKLSL